MITREEAKAISDLLEMAKECLSEAQLAIRLAVEKTLPGKNLMVCSKMTLEAAESMMFAITKAEMLACRQMEEAIGAATANRSPA